MELGRFWTDACHSVMFYVGFGGCLARGLVKFGLRQARGVDVRVASDHGDVQVIEALLGRRGGLVLESARWFLSARQWR